MEPAQRDQVREFGLAAVRPMLDVVPVDVAFVGAAREKHSLYRARRAPDAAPAGCCASCGRHRAARRARPR